MEGILLKRREHMRRAKREGTWEEYRNKYGYKAAYLEHRREYSIISYNQRKKEGYRENRVFTGIEQTEGFQNHHITKSFTISLPSFIHNSVPHSLRGYGTYGMEEINEKAFNFLIGNF